MTMNKNVSFKIVIYRLDYKVEIEFPLNYSYSFIKTFSIKM